MQLFIRFRNALAALLMAVPVAIFWAVWARLAVNVPKWDDHALKAFLLNLSHETSASGQLFQFWRQHNEHRIVVDRVLTWADVRLFGALDYTHLMLVGNLMLIGLLVVFGLVIIRSGRWWGGVVPVAFLLFNLSHWENMFWGMAAPANFGVVLWTVACLYMLSFSRTLVAPLIFAILATLTIGNGLVIWPLGTGLLALQSRWRGLVVWLVAAGLLIGAYFLGYESPTYNPPAVPTISTMLTCFLAFLGAAAEAVPVGSVLSNCVGLGVILVAASAWYGVGLLWRWRDRANWSRADFFFLGTVGFLLGTALVVARSRAGYGVETLITSRYKIYSLTLMSVLFVRLVTGQRWLRSPLQTGLAGAGLLLSVGLAYLSYATYRAPADDLHKYLITSQFNWTYTQARPVAVIDPATSRILHNAPAFYDRQLSAIFGPPTGANLLIDSLFRQGNEWVVQNRTVMLPPASMPDEGLYLRLQSTNRTYLLPARPVLVSGLRAKLSLTAPASRGVTLNLSPADVGAGTYRLDWLRVNPSGGCAVIPSGRTLTLTGQQNAGTRTNW